MAPSKLHTTHTVNYPTWSGVFNKLKFDHLLKKIHNSTGALIRLRFTTCSRLDDILPTRFRLFTTL